MPSGRLMVFELAGPAGAGDVSAGGGAGLGAWARAGNVEKHTVHASRRIRRGLKYTSNVEELRQDTTLIEALPHLPREEDGARHTYRRAVGECRVEGGADISVFVNRPVRIENSDALGELFGRHCARRGGRRGDYGRGDGQQLSDDGICILVSHQTDDEHRPFWMPCGKVRTERTRPFRIVRCIEQHAPAA